jgi:hypothetical protein
MATRELESDRMLNLSSRLLCGTNLQFQVAVKVIRDVSSNIDYFNQLKIVGDTEAHDG